VGSGSIPSPLSSAKRKVFETLRASQEIAEVSDLYPDSRYTDSAAFGAFEPIFFVYRPPNDGQPEGKKNNGTPQRFYFVYNGRFLIVGAFCGPDGGIPALSEAVSEVCLLMSKSGYEFRWLSPIPTLQSLNFGGTSTASSSLDGVLNVTAGGVGTTTILRNGPRSVQGSLRSLYAASFQHMTAFYSLKEESDTQEALLQTIEAHRVTVLDLMHEFSQAKWWQLPRKRKLRKLIRAHCFSIMEKIGRVDALSDSIAHGITSLDGNLRQDPDLTFMLEAEPNWKSYLAHEFDTRPVMEMVSRTSEEISRRDMGLIVFLVALLAAVAGGLIGSVIGRAI